VSPIAARFLAGKSTPAIRAIVFLFPLSLPLLMFRVGADDAHNAFAVDHFALVTHFFDGRSHFHLSLQ
jgi:hypothetical protein